MRKPQINIFKHKKPVLCMNKTLIIILVISVIIASILISAVIISRQINLSPDINPADLEECKTLSYNGEGKINIVIFAPKETAEKYSDYFLGIDPFNKNKEQFNFFYIDTYTPECELYENTAILCYNEEIIKKAASCPNDYVFVVLPKDKEIRSSSYMNLISLNSNHQLTVLLHEFAHAFANLADEYVPATLPKKTKNCAANCDKFPVKDGCYPGCSEADYYRSIENGVMRTLSSSDYGLLNKLLITEKITESEKNKITGNAIENQADCSNQQYILIKGNYENNKIEILNKTIEPGCAGGNGAGQFEYNIILQDNAKITGGEFNPELIFTDSQPDNETEIQGSAQEYTGIFMLKLPLMSNSKTLEISKDNQIISEINMQDIGARPCKK